MTTVEATITHPIHFVQVAPYQMTFNAFCRDRGIAADRARFWQYCQLHGYEPGNTLSEDRWAMLLTQFDSLDQRNTQHDALS